MPIVRSAVPFTDEAPWLEALAALRQLGRELSSFAAAETARDVSLRLIVESVVQWLPGASVQITLAELACEEHDPAAHIPRGSLADPCPGGSMCFPLHAAGETVGALHVELSGERTCSQTEQLLVQILCDYAALALRSARPLAGSSPERVASFPAKAPCPAPGCAAQAGDSPRAQALPDGMAALPANVNRVSEMVTAPRTEPSGRLAVLTVREREVLALLAEGMTNKQIASVLVITPNTVKRHLKAIFEKLCVRTRSAAAAKAISARFPV